MSNLKRTKATVNCVLVKTNLTGISVEFENTGAMPLTEIPMVESNSMSMRQKINTALTMAVSLFEAGISTKIDFIMDKSPNKCFDEIMEGIYNFDKRNGYYTFNFDSKLRFKLKMGDIFTVTCDNYYLLSYQIGDDNENTAMNICSAVIENGQTIIRVFNDILEEYSDIVFHRNGPYEIIASTKYYTFIITPYDVWIVIKSKKSIMKLNDFIESKRRHSIPKYQITLMNAICTEYSKMVGNLIPSKVPSKEYYDEIHKDPIRINQYIGGYGE